MSCYIVDITVCS